MANGAATLSTLTFIGTVTAAQRPNLIPLDVVAYSLYYFALGTGFASLTVAIAYIARILRSDHYTMFYRTMMFIGVSAGIASLILFFMGIFNMKGSLAGFGRSQFYVSY